MRSRRVVTPPFLGYQVIVDHLLNQPDSTEMSTGVPPPSPPHTAESLSEDPVRLLTNALNQHLSWHKQSFSRAALACLDSQPDPACKNFDGTVPSQMRPIAPTELTARALIALASISERPNASIRRSLRFLTEQIRVEDGSVRSVPNALEEGWPGGPEVSPDLRAQLPESKGVRRTYPSALALIALCHWNAEAEHIDRIRTFLLNEYDSGTWGAFPEARPRPAFTAIAVHALICAGEPPSRFREAAQSLRRSQLDGGRWPREEEVWSVRDERGDHFAATRIDTTVQCVDALAALKGAGNFRALWRGRRYLRAQEKVLSN